MRSKRITLTLFVFFKLTLSLIPNDGAFYSSGNQLIPIQETDIECRKEILTIKRVGEGYKTQFEVTVDYTFYNPGPEKTITVGFEAFAPGGDANGTPSIDGSHPYIHDFTVRLNDSDINVKPAIVNLDQNHEISFEKKFPPYEQNDTLSKSQIDSIVTLGQIFNWVSYEFVYYFEATFKKGENKVIHTYRYDGGLFVNHFWEFSYKLTPALRWANKQIDDFTLILELGENINYQIVEPFFDDLSNWNHKESGSKMILRNSYQDKYDIYSEIKMTYVLQKSQRLIFNAKNFKPKTELSIIKKSQNLSNVSYLDENLKAIPFDYENIDLPFEYNHLGYENWMNFYPNFESKNYRSFNILRNLPYARRGMFFDTKFIQDYYEKQNWYLADSNYVPVYNDLFDSEKEWLKSLKVAEQ